MLSNKYLNDDQPETITASSSLPTLRIESNQGSGGGGGIHVTTYSTVDETAAVYGESKATSRNVHGVMGVSNSPGSSGVGGGSSVGVYGVAKSSTSIGGSALGVLGRTFSVPVAGADVSVGVFGWADPSITSGRTYGVWGETSSSTTWVSGVYGVNRATSGETRGVTGVVESTGGGAAGVLGHAPNSGNVRGVMGYSHSPDGYAVYSDGNFAVAQNYTTLADSWETRSSRRWKTDITPIENALDKVKRLNGVNFSWKESGKHDIGLIAEEVGEVIPEIVKYEDNGQDAKSIDYSRLVSVLIEAVKEQQKDIDALKGEIIQLKQQRSE